MIFGDCEGCGTCTELELHARAGKFLCDVCFHIASNL